MNLDGSKVKYKYLTHWRLVLSILGWYLWVMHVIAKSNRLQWVNIMVLKVLLSEQGNWNNFVLALWCHWCKSTYTTYSVHYASAHKHVHTADACIHTQLLTPTHTHTHTHTNKQTHTDTPIHWQDLISAPISPNTDPSILFFYHLKKERMTFDHYKASELRT